MGGEKTRVGGEKSRLKEFDGNGEGRTEAGGKTGGGLDREDEQRTIHGKEVGVEGSSKAGKKKAKKGRRRQSKEKSSDPPATNGEGEVLGRSAAADDLVNTGRGEIETQGVEERAKRENIEMRLHREDSDAGGKTDGEGVDGDKKLGGEVERIREELVYAEELEATRISGELKATGISEELEATTRTEEMEATARREELEEAVIKQAQINHMKKTTERLASSEDGKEAGNIRIAVEIQRSGCGGLEGHEEVEGELDEPCLPTIHGEFLESKNLVGEFEDHGTVFLQEGVEEGECRGEIRTKGVVGLETDLGDVEEGVRVVDSRQDNSNSSRGEKTMEVFVGAEDYRMASTVKNLGRAGS